VNHETRKSCIAEL